MTRNPALQADVKRRVRRFVEENFIFADPAQAFSDSASFIQHQIIDSTGFLEVVTFLEAQYDIRITDEEMVPENLDNLEAIGAFVARKTGA